MEKLEIGDLFKSGTVLNVVELIQHTHYAYGTLLKFNIFILPFSL